MYLVYTGGSFSVCIRLKVSSNYKLFKILEVTFAITFIAVLNSNDLKSQETFPIAGCLFFGRSHVCQNCD